MATKKVIKKTVNNEVEMDNIINEGDNKMVKKKVIKKEESVDPIKEAIKKANQKTEEAEINKKKKSSNIVLNDIDEEEDMTEDEIDEEEDNIEDEIDEEEAVKEEPIKKKNEKGGKKSILKKNGKEVQSNKKLTNIGKVNTIKKDDCIDRFVNTVNSYLDRKGYDGLDRSILEIIYNMALKVPFDMIIENLQKIIDDNNGNFDDIPKEDLKLNTSIYGGKSLKGTIMPGRIYRGNPISNKETYAPIGVKVYFNISTAKTMEIFEETENEIIVLDENDNKITFKK